MEKRGEAEKQSGVRSRRRNAAATRARIIEAAAVVFARDGYSAATLRDIGALAGVDHALTVRYTGAKAGLFSAALAEEVARWPGLPDGARGAALASRICAGKDDRLWRLVLAGANAPVSNTDLRSDLLAKMGLAPASPADEQAIFAQNMLFITCLGAAAVTRSHVVAASVSVEAPEAKLGLWLQWLLYLARGTKNSPPKKVSKAGT